MTALREKESVASEALMFYGLKGLRVVDASVFSMVPRGNIITSVCATAEKASDLIKEDWKEWYRVSPIAEGMVDFMTS
jgi:choline dehydrogenase-like flavoprotein